MHLSIVAIAGLFANVLTSSSRKGVNALAELVNLQIVADGYAGAGAAKLR